MKPAVASRHTNWEEYIRDPAFVTENEELFLSSLRSYQRRGGTLMRAAELIANAEPVPVDPMYRMAQ